MLSRSPVMKSKALIIPTLEKILVDLYCEEKLFYAYQGFVLSEIFQNCFEKYIINYSRLFNYVKRRTKEAAFLEFLSTTIPEQVKDLLE
jgi:hypothetical protein